MCDAAGKNQNPTKDVKAGAGEASEVGETQARRGWEEKTNTKHVGKIQYELENR